MSGTAAPTAPLVRLTRRRTEALADFQCTRCGGCCGDWLIHVDEESFRRVSRLVKNAPLPRPNPQQPWFVMLEEKPVYSLTPEGRCVFVTSKGHCWLHWFGLEYKSAICRSFPLEEVLTPRGLDQTISFVSRGAIEQCLLADRPFRLVEDVIECSLAADPVERPIPDLPHWTWDDHALFEDRLLDLIGGADQLEDGLAAGARFAAACEARARRGDGEGSLPGIPAFSTPIRDPERARDFVLAFIEKRIKLIKNVASFDSTGVLLRAAREDVRTARAASDEVRTARLESAAGAFARPIRLFILYRIFAKQVFLRFGLLRGFNLLCLMYRLLRFRLAAAREEPTAADFKAAMIFTEHQVTHSFEFVRHWSSLFERDGADSAELGEILARS